MAPFIFPDEKLKKLSEEGYQLYQLATQSCDAQDWYKAGDKYDVTYTGLWGDVLFSGVQFGTTQFVMTGLALSLPFLSKEEEKEMFEKSLLAKREMLVVSCEFYLKAIEIEPNHFYANLQLATALTAALQVIPGCLYWSKALQLRQADALRALTADSMAKFHRGIATHLVILDLKDNQAKMQAAVSKVQSNFTFLEQMRVATDLLRSSPYIRSRIEKFGLSEQKIPENHSSLKNSSPTDILTPSGELKINEYLRSANGKYTLIMQSDGNLVLYSSNLALWCSNTTGLGGEKVVMQLDGNLVLYSSRKAIWNSQTSKRLNSFLKVQDDGNVVIYENNLIPIWCTNTAQND
ncbi:hypothetical protein C7H19_23990 [Aphanothece hegewaldii CCALA 016]|uniref:Bulb-type lectin domain-containing protein n=1 Tax=Aphanothece hegewaldii CCALA 016 TaxID=2107694 RepID=A0A2T1LQY2_9CHRO|nr:hypothetical protein [Aphanothece hegewaldii]PSF30244.1 hypothetical protein C7H19_23990 [Aphanothece hegewaldii CCALA 016]